MEGWDPEIISVSAAGQITPENIGETTITASYTGFEATIKVIVADMG